MSKLNEKDIRNAVRKSLMEKYFDEFDEFEFDTSAKEAAKKDIESSGEEFEELGSSKFEKDPEFKKKFKSALKQANLGLSSDEEEVERLAQSIKKKKEHEKKFGAGSMNETDSPKRDVFDTTSLYKFLKDIMWTLKDGDGSDLDYAQAAKFAEEELVKNFDFKKKNAIQFGLNELDFPELMNQFKANMEKEMTPKTPSNETPEEKKKRIDTELARLKAKELERQKEAGENLNEENDAKTNRYMFFSNLEQLKRQAALMLGLDQQKVSDILEGGHDWAQDHVATAKESMDQVFDFIMNETKKEKTVEESNIRSHANGRGQNLKPKNYPKAFKRSALREGKELLKLKKNNMKEGIELYKNNDQRDAEMLYAKFSEEANYLIYKKLHQNITASEDRRLNKINRELEKMGDKHLGVLDFDYIKKYEMMFAKQRNDEGYIDYLENAEASFEHGFNDADNFEIDDSDFQNEEYDFSAEERAFHNQQNFEEEMDEEVYFVVDNDFNKAHYPDLIGKTFDSPPAYAQVKLVKRGESIDTPRTLGDKDVQENSSDSLANQHGENAKPETIDEVTDKERYEEVVSLDGQEANHALNILMQDGKDEAMEYLKQWHNPGQGMGSETLGHGSMDKTYEKDGYIMNWNSALGYIGLVYDTEFGKELDEDSLMKRHLAGQREKNVPLGQHAPHSQKAKK